MRRQDQQVGAGGLIYLQIESAPARIFVRIGDQFLCDGLNSSVRLGLRSVELQFGDAAAQRGIVVRQQETLVLLPVKCSCKPRSMTLKTFSAANSSHHGRP